MSSQRDRLSRLFFPLTALKLPAVLAAGQTLLDLEVKKSGGRYKSQFFKDRKPLKLSLEKIDENDFTEAFLDAYYFRQPDKEYNSARKLLARLGMHAKSPLEMEYSDQKYILKTQGTKDGASFGLQIFYSPVVGRIVVRRMTS